MVQLVFCVVFCFYIDSCVLGSVCVKLLSQGWGLLLGVQIWMCMWGDFSVGN